MKSFRSYFVEDLGNLNFTGDEKKFALDLLSDIDDQISTINTTIEYDGRPGKQNSKRLGISQLIDDKDREKYSALARDLIDKHPDLSRGKVSSGRREKDYAIVYKDLDKTIYVNVRPTGKRSSAGDDPNELMTAALCLQSKVPTPTNTDEMDALIDVVEKSLGKVKGYKQGQADALTGDYPNMCQAVSAAIAIHKAGYGDADQVYLTGQAWDDDVKQFQRTQHGMADFNSSDFIIKKGDNYLGVSLKKKKLKTSGDPTLINKAFTSLLAGPKFDKIRAGIEKDAGDFYVHVIKLAQRTKALSPELMRDLKTDKPTNKNWKQYIQRVPNPLVNRVLKGKKTLFKTMGKTVLDNGDMIAGQLVNLIFKADLKDLQKVNFDFTLVTGVGDYGPKKGVDISPGEYTDIDTVTTRLDDLFSNGEPKIIFTPGAKQAFDPGASAANLKFDLMIGKVTVCNITLRYKGNFRSAPNFTAEMTKEFKKIMKG